VLEQIIHEITELIGPLLLALRNGVAEANGNQDVLTQLARQFAQNWCRTALGDPRTQKRIPPIVREVIQPSRHFTVIYNGFFRVLHNVLGELLAAAHGQAATDEQLANSNAYHHECGVGIHFHGVHSLAPDGMERL
jgi:HTH-type transcriptional dual regulator CecR, C-terminal domain